VESELTNAEPGATTLKESPKVSIWRSNGWINVSVAIQGSVTPEDMDMLVDQAVVSFERAFNGVKKYEKRS
jgi:hypothetical protein